MLYLKPIKSNELAKHRTGQMGQVIHYLHFPIMPSKANKNLKHKTNYANEN